MCCCLGLLRGRISNSRSLYSLRHAALHFSRISYSTIEFRDISHITYRNTSLRSHFTCRHRLSLNLHLCLHIFQIFTRYGKCYTFNSGQDGRPLMVTMKGGMGNGLELMLDIQQDEYLPVWGETGKRTCRVHHISNSGRDAAAKSTCMLLSQQLKGFFLISRRTKLPVIFSIVAKTNLTGGTIYQGFSL